MPETLTVEVAIGRFASEARGKLRAIAAKGEPEDQIRNPLEVLIGDLADLAGTGRKNVVVIGESSIADMKTRPDFAIQVRGALLGFIEVKAPGKGADPRKFKDKHDKDQWSKLSALPNLVYTDGNEFSLWRNGELQGSVVKLDGDIASDGASVSSAPGIVALFEDFFTWEPTPPRTPKQLADLAARVCRLMRDEVAEQMARGNPALTGLAAEWRTLLFPDADADTFADGYAQAVTFGLLVARARGLSLSNGVGAVAKQIGTHHSLIGGALFILTSNTESHDTLKTSIGTLTRVLDVVDWPALSKNNPDAWLYFYEEFLSVYDAALRKKTGSYYTPPEVVKAMVAFVESALRTRFGRPSGLASDDVMLIDPAVGTGTFLLAALRSIAETVATDEGDGAVPARLDDALRRLVGFEIQLGPFAVAQLRLLAELADLGVVPGSELRMYVTDTLGNPYVEDEHLGMLYESVAESRRRANEIKKSEPVLVVIGNPPYKEKAKGRGGWVESGNPSAKVPAPLEAWMPPRDWGVGAHAKHLRNLYVYFWRWATWKLFDHERADGKGIVCFITVAGFLNGPGFQKMRDDLRRRANEIWVIDCSPEGHQPEVSTRIFQGVQQPVCIVIAAQSSDPNLDEPAVVRFRSLPTGARTDKFQALASMGLDDNEWVECPSGWRDPFLPASTGAWATYPALSDFFVYDGSGVMPGRTWVIAPDRPTLEQRWNTLVSAPKEQQEDLFRPHLRNGVPGDKHVNKVVTNPLPGYPERRVSVADDRGEVAPPIRYGFRSFDRQWIIPDNRVINQPNPGLWTAMSGAQVYLTCLHRTSPKTGPAVTATAFMPDLDHFKGSFGGRVMPLWLDHAATVSNIRPGLLAALGQRLGRNPDPVDVFAYITALLAHPAYTARFADDLSTPGLRVPLTADSALFERVVALGRRVLWLHAYGDRFGDPENGRPHGRPRLAPEHAPRVPASGTISNVPGQMADRLDFDAEHGRLLVGDGYIENVTPAMWSYEVSGMHVLGQWFSYRRASRERPTMGDKRPPSRLEEIRPDRWLAEYTTDLIDLLHVLGLLVDLEPQQADLLAAVCDANTISIAELAEANALTIPDEYPVSPFRATQSDGSASARLFD